MLQIYVISGIAYYISFLLLYIRVLANKSSIKWNKDSEGIYSFIRFALISFIPLINTICALYWLYLSLMTTKDKFSKTISD